MNNCICKYRNILKLIRQMIQWMNSFIINEENWVIMFVREWNQNYLEISYPFSIHWTKPKLYCGSRI